MKGTKGFGSGGHGPGPFDLGTIFDEIFEAARDFQNEFRRNFANSTGKSGAEPQGGTRQDDSQPHCRPWFFGENTDYYPNYSYPPMNVYMTADMGLVYEFALAGFEEKDISLSFQGDYMVFQATVPRNADGAPPDGTISYMKRRLKMKDIEKQKFFVPQDYYAQEKVKAVFRNGILKVTIPPKEEPDQSNGVKIEIMTDEE